MKLLNTSSFIGSSNIANEKLLFTLLLLCEFVCVFIERGPHCENESKTLTYSLNGIFNNKL